MKGGRRRWRTPGGRPLLHRGAGGRRFRARLPRPDQSRQGADREGRALQEGIRTFAPEVYRLPFPYCYRCEKADRRSLLPGWLVPSPLDPRGDVRSCAHGDGDPAVRVRNGTRLRSPTAGPGREASLDPLLRAGAQPCACSSMPRGSSSHAQRGSRGHGRTTHSSARLLEVGLSLADGQRAGVGDKGYGTPVPEKVSGLRSRVAVDRAGRRVPLAGTPVPCSAAGLRSAAAAGAARARARPPRIAGVDAPGFRWRAGGRKSARVERIRRSEAELVLVGWVPPSRSASSTRAYRRWALETALGVGASIDFLAGRVRRAPRWVSRWPGVALPAGGRARRPGAR